MTRHTKRVNWTGRVVPVTNRPLYELQQVVNALNGKLRWEEVIGSDDLYAEEKRQREAPPLLREIVRRWQLSGPNLDKFSIDNRALWAEVDEHWKKTPVQLVGAPTGGAAIWWNSFPMRNPREEALRWFIWLLVNPECARLAGPCARCKSYYIRGSARNKVYCSRSCGTRATALAATRKRRDEEHADKLLRAAEAAREWTTARTKKEWKAWVSGRYPDITAKFLTRTVNKDQLNPPTKREKP
jgi:hypothetical protein